jgi:hypothetical protein
MDNCQNQNSFYWFLVAEKVLKSLYVKQTLVANHLSLVGYITVLL